MAIDSFYGIANWHFLERHFGVIPWVILYTVRTICLLIGLEPTVNFGHQCNLQLSAYR